MSVNVEIKACRDFWLPRNSGTGNFLQHFIILKIEDTDRTSETII